jgi:hypothetical protein
MGMLFLQVLTWTKGLRQLIIIANKADKPLPDDQQNLAACDVLLGPAYSSSTHGISLAEVQQVTIEMVSWKHVQLVTLRFGTESRIVDQSLGSV